MTFAFPTLSFMNDCDCNEDLFSCVIERLKSQNALPSHSFIKEVPFFNLPTVSREAQIKELFESSCEPSICRQLLKNIIPFSEGAEYKLLPQNYSPISVMSFAQIILYKVLPCPETHCSNCPREIATHNQYKDYEYECPFYHHERDRRRLVISDGIDEEFVYKANYYEEGRRRGDKEKYSQNYFESMFHPLYYKMFRCKRDFCNHSVFCPFFHTEDEKNMWDDIFGSFIKKDRVSYVKDKQQKVQDKKPNRNQYSRRKESEEEIFAKENNCFVDRRNNNQQKHRRNLKPVYQQPNNNQMFQYTDKPNFEKNWKAEFVTYRKNSDDSSSEDSYGGYGFFSKLQATMGF